MVEHHLLSRRNILRFGIGAVTFMAGSALARVSYRNVQIQKLANASKDFSVAEANQSLREFAARKQLIYGSATGYEILASDSDLASHWVSECEILVPENDLKWNALRPSPEAYDFTAADWLLNFSKTNNVLMRGHTLIWHEQLPSWFQDTVNYKNAEQFLVNHIETVVGRYAGKLHSWDVVNEAIDPQDDRPDGLRNTPWLKFLGPNYIDLAFRIAAKADPQALLVYNDYGLEYDIPWQDAKRRAVLDLLKRLKAQGTPIHALGIQGHLDGSETRFKSEQFRQFLRDVASLGLKIMITELDVKDADLPADIAVRDRIVAAACEDYLSVALDESAVIAVLTWGLSDRYTWLSDTQPRNDGLPVRPLPLDENMNRKLAWNAIARAFDNAPLRAVERT